MKFYLGIHVAAWSYRISVPYMLSVRLVLKRKKLLKGNDWLLDSGGFSELKLHGCYKISEDEYIECIKHLKPNYAFCQDWMCERQILKRTGKEVEEHQELTIKSYTSLRKKSYRILPVLQGYTPDDYINHIKMYKKHKVNLNQLFGLGSVCKRSRTEIPEIIIPRIRSFAPEIKIHAFGLKITAFKKPVIVNNLYSADSMAWSYDGRFNYGALRRTNSLAHALIWRNKVLKEINKNYYYKIT